MPRHEWTIAMGGAELLPFARKQHEFHAERLAFWAREMEESKRAFKDQGITIIDNAEAEAFGDRTIAYRGSVNIKVDPTVEQRFEQCRLRVREHENKAREFNRWAIAFERNPNQSFSLDIGDMEHFGI